MQLHTAQRAMRRHGIRCSGADNWHTGRSLPSCWTAAWYSPSCSERSASSRNCSEPPRSTSVQVCAEGQPAEWWGDRGGAEMGWAGHGAGHCSEASKAQAGKQWAWIPAQAPAGWQTHQPAFVPCVWPANDVFLPCWHHDLLAGHAPVKRLYRSAPTCRSWNCAQLPSALALRLFTVVWIWPPVAMATRCRSSSATCGAGRRCFFQLN